MTFNGSGNASGAADPKYTGYPDYIFDNDCRLVGLGYYDKVFKIVGGNEGCYKILRTWCMADWCSLGEYSDDPQWWFNPKYEGKYLSWVQKILLIDTIAPICTIEIPDIVEAAGCLYDLNTVVTIDDNCGVLDYSWELLDKNAIRLGHGAGQIIDQSSNSVLINKTGLVPGSYTLKVHVTDECQNESICKKDFVIEAQKKPTPVCISALTLELNPMDTDGDGQIDTAMGMIWASEFNQSSSAACGSLTSDLKFRLDRLSDGDPGLPADDHLTFGCSDIGVVALRMYVLDASGTWDYCEVVLTVQDNGGSCDNGISSGRISGMITNELNRIVHDIEMTLTDPDGIHVGARAGIWRLPF